MSYKSELGDFEIRKKYKKGDFLANDKYIVTYDYTVGNGYAMQGGLYGVCGVRKDEPDKFIVRKFIGPESGFTRRANDSEFNILADTITNSGYKRDKENQKLIKTDDHKADEGYRNASYFKEIADKAIKAPDNDDSLCPCYDISQFLRTIGLCIEIQANNGLYDCSFLFTDRNNSINTILEYFKNRKFQVKASLISYSNNRQDYWLTISWKEEG